MIKIEKDLIILMIERKVSDDSICAEPEPEGRTRMEQISGLLILENNLKFGLVKFLGADRPSG